MNKIELLEKIVAEEPVESELTEKFNAEISFGEKELISLLFYLGYLTIKYTKVLTRNVQNDNVQMYLNNATVKSIPLTEMQKKEKKHEKKH